MQYISIGAVDSTFDHIDLLKWQLGKICKGLAMLNEYSTAQERKYCQYTENER